MAGVRKRGEEIRQFILAHVGAHPEDVATLTASTFGISRQAVNGHIHYLVAQNALHVSGTTRSKRYSLLPLVQRGHSYPIQKDLAEDLVWRRDVRPLLGELPENVLTIWQHSFTEIFNNALEHSAGQCVQLWVTKTAGVTEIMIYDDGEGIFKKIQRELGLDDERHAILELAKGKLTTDPVHHSGEGVFFTSRMCDAFSIMSGHVFFAHKCDQAEDWILEDTTFHAGTCVSMSVKNNTSRTTKQVFDQFTSGEDYGFTKTVVPVRLAQYGEEKLLSRSQAKRLLARIDRFKTVVLNFEAVETIGQAFADEVFRVFRNAHPEVELMALNANQLVQQMISRAEHADRLAAHETSLA